MQLLVKMLISAVAILAAGTTAANAQWDGLFFLDANLHPTGVPIDPARTLVATHAPCPPANVPCLGVFGIPLNNFATVADVNNRVDTINAQISKQISNMSRDISRSFEIGAIAAAMRDAIPNAGDRFAVRLNMAGFDGYAAGAIGVSMNVTDSVRLSANYGRSSTQNVVSGGVNMSFR